MTRSTRIVVNTVASYARLAVAAVAGFFTLPIVLRTLGATDYGIFSVIAGSLSFLLFINSALTSGAQRHIAYSLGEGKTDEAGQWFNASLVIHMLLGLSILLPALLASHWVINNLLSLPPSRLAASMWIYRAVIVVVFCSIISTPYQALLMAKESIMALSLMAMASSVFLVIGVLLLKMLPGDSLVWYSGIYTVSDGFVLAGPIFFCLAYYSECRQLSPNMLQWRKVRELLGFSGWNLFGTLAVQIRYQGPAILLNRFVGTTANAAYGIALEVNGFASNLSTGLIRSTAPSIVKSEAFGDRAEMLLFSNLSNKYAFVFLWLLIGPLLFQLKYCLSMWLSQMPPDTLVFSTALLIALLLDMLTAGFMAAVQAEGRIALYQCVIGFLLCISVPVGYLLLRFHMPARSVLWALVGSSALAGAGRLWFICKRIGFRKAEWVRGVILPCAATCILCCLAMEAVVMAVKSGLLRLAALYLVNSGFSLALAWTFASSEKERRVCNKYVATFQRHAFSGSRRMLAFALKKTY